MNAVFERDFVGFGTSGRFQLLRFGMAAVMGTTLMVLVLRAYASQDFSHIGEVLFAASQMIGFLLLVSLVVSAGVEALQNYVADRMAGEALWLQWANALFSFAIFTVLFALIFQFLPDARIPWRDVWLGAVVTAVLFVVGKWAIGLYLGRTAATSAFGAAASVIVLLLWVYYASFIVLLGAGL